MIKFVLAAVWIVAAALGAVFYSFQSAQSNGSDKPPAPISAVSTISRPTSSRSR